MGQPIPQPTPQPMGQPIGQPIGQPTPQPIPQPMGQPIPQPTPQPMGQPMGQPIGQPIGQPTPQSTPQPQNQQLGGGNGVGGASNSSVNPEGQVPQPQNGQPTGQPTPQMYTTPVSLQNSVVSVNKFASFEDYISISGKNKTVIFDSTDKKTEYTLYIKDSDTNDYYKVGDDLSNGKKFDKFIKDNSSKLVLVSNSEPQKKYKVQYQLSRSNEWLLGEDKNFSGNIKGYGYITDGRLLKEMNSYVAFENSDKSLYIEMNPATLSLEGFKSLCDYMQDLTSNVLYQSKKIIIKSVGIDNLYFPQKEYPITLPESYDDKVNFIKEVFDKNNFTKENFTTETKYIASQLGALAANSQLTQLSVSSEPYESKLNMSSYVYSHHKMKDAGKMYIQMNPEFLTLDGFKNLCNYMQTIDFDSIDEIIIKSAGFVGTGKTEYSIKLPDKDRDTLTKKIFDENNFTEENFIGKTSCIVSQLKVLNTKYINSQQPSQQPSQQTEQSTGQPTPQPTPQMHVTPISLQNSVVSVNKFASFEDYISISGKNKTVIFDSTDKKTEYTLYIKDSDTNDYYKVGDDLSNGKKFDKFIKDNSSKLVLVSNSEPQKKYKVQYQLSRSNEWLLGEDKNFSGNIKGYGYITDGRLNKENNKYVSIYNGVLTVQMNDNYLTKDGFKNLSEYVKDLEGINTVREINFISSRKNKEFKCKVTTLYKKEAIDAIFNTDIFDDKTTISTAEISEKANLILKDRSRFKKFALLSNRLERVRQSNHDLMMEIIQKQRINSIRGSQNLQSRPQMQRVGQNQLRYNMTPQRSQYTPLTQNASNRRRMLLLARQKNMNNQTMFSQAQQKLNQIPRYNRSQQSMNTRRLQTIQQARTLQPQYSTRPQQQMYGTRPQQQIYSTRPQNGTSQSQYEAKRRELEQLRAQNQILQQEIGGTPVKTPQVAAKPTATPIVQNKPDSIPDGLRSLQNSDTSTREQQPIINNNSQQDLMDRLNKL